jgi:DNA-binding NarL/FixJ family response regulator
MSEPRPPIRIVIADDHPLVRDGLRKLLEGQSGFRVIGEAADGIEALERAKALEPDVLLLDLAMPRMNGLEVLSALADSTTSVRTVLLTAAIEGEETVRALRLGARGVVLKESATEQLYLCIRAVMRGEFWVGREHVGDLLQALRQLERASSPPPPAATLTARERQIIAAVVEGASNRDIGKMIGVSEQTVKNRLSSIFDKLGVSSRLELALYAVHHGLLADGEQSAGTPPRTS